MSATRSATRQLLAIVELGGYPNFTPLYERHGYAVSSERSVRRAITLLRSLMPAVIVAEFNFQSDFRDRTSSLESLLATVQRLYGESAGVRVIVLYEREFAHQLDRLLARFPVHATLAYPVDESMLESALVDDRDDGGSAAK